jgi:hypothetical protein
LDAEEWEVDGGGEDRGWRDKAGEWEGGRDVLVAGTADVSPANLSDMAYILRESGMDRAYTDSVSLTKGLKLGESWPPRRRTISFMPSMCIRQLLVFPIIF